MQAGGQVLDQAAATHTAAHSLSKAELQAIAERLQGAGRLKGTVPSAEMVRTWRRLAEDCQPAADTTGEPQWIYYLIAELGVGTALQEAGEWKASAEHLEAVLAHENGLAPSWWAQMHAIAAESYLIGGLLGYLIGTYVPGYYETVFTLPEDVNIVTLGTVLGMTQGLVAGLVLGAIVVVCTTWYEVSKLNWRDEDEAATPDE